MQGRTRKCKKTKQNKKDRGKEETNRKNKDLLQAFDTCFILYQIVRMFSVGFFFFLLMKVDRSDAARICTSTAEVSSVSTSERISKCSQVPKVSRYLVTVDNWVSAELEETTPLR